MTKAKEQGCKCPVCLYGNKIRDLIHRTQDPADKALIEELYDNLIHAEDDRDYHRFRNEGCKVKHGGISFFEACNVIEAHRSQEGKPS